VLAGWLIETTRSCGSRWTTIATAFCPTEFTIGDLRNVYEVVGANRWIRATSAAR
jgi:hypothetical protein